MQKQKNGLNMKVIEKIRQNCKDYLLMQTIFVCFVLAICHTVQFVRSGYMLQAGIRAVLMTLYVFIAPFAGRKCWSPLLFVYGLAILYPNRYYNYTSFCLLLLAVKVRPKCRMPYLLIYFFAVLVCLIVYKDTFNHAIIHFFGCYLFYFADRQFVKAHCRAKKRCAVLKAQNRQLAEQLEEMQHKNRKLDLTADETLIISQLAAGAEVKEIEEFSENTIYKKLSNARVRNNCVNNSDLVSRYKLQLERESE